MKLQNPTLSSPAGTRFALAAILGAEFGASPPAEAAGVVINSDRTSKAHSPSTRRCILGDILTSSFSDPEPLVSALSMEFNRGVYAS